MLFRLSSILVGVWMGSLLFGGQVQAQVTATPGCEGLPPLECSARQQKCAPATGLMRGTGGPMGPIFTCATQLAIPKTQITPFIGPAFASGHPESIIDKITNDTKVLTDLRRCMLLNAGLVGATLGLNDTINREAFAGKAQALLSWNPPMAAILANAARTCPEPPNLQYQDFLSCVQSRCIQDLSVSAFSYTSPEEKKKKKGKCKKKKC